MAMERQKEAGGMSEKIAGQHLKTIEKYAYFINKEAGTLPQEREVKTYEKYERGPATVVKGLSQKLSPVDAKNLLDRYSKKIDALGQRVFGDDGKYGQMAVKINLSKYEGDYETSSYPGMTRKNLGIAFEKYGAKYASTISNFEDYLNTIAVIMELQKVEKDLFSKEMEPAQEPVVAEIDETQRTEHRLKLKIADIREKRKDLAEARKLAEGELSPDDATALAQENKALAIEDLTVFGEIFRHERLITHEMTLDKKAWEKVNSREIETQLLPELARFFAEFKAFKPRLGLKLSDALTDKLDSIFGSIGSGDISKALMNLRKARVVLHETIRENGLEPILLSVPASPNIWKGVFETEKMEKPEPKFAAKIKKAERKHEVVTIEDETPEVKADRKAMFHQVNVFRFIDVDIAEHFRDRRIKPLIDLPLPSGGKEKLKEEYRTITDPTEKKLFEETLQEADTIFSEFISNYTELINEVPTYDLSSLRSAVKQAADYFAEGDLTAMTLVLSGANNKMREELDRIMKEEARKKTLEISGEAKEENLKDGT